MSGDAPAAPPAPAAPADPTSTPAAPAINAPDPAALAQLLDKQAIAERLFLYARGWDRYDLDLLIDTFHDDAEILHGGREGNARALMKQWFGMLETSTRTMTHLISNVLVTPAGDRAVSEAHFLAHHRRLATATHGERDWFIKGRYLDQWARRADGIWRIARRTGLLDFERLADPADPELSQLSEDARGGRSPGDPVYRLLLSV